MFVHTGLMILLAGVVCAKTLEKPHFTANIDKSVSFLLFSDVHLDLMYKKTADKRGSCRNESIKSSHIASYGRIECDSPLSLLLNALSAMKPITKKLSKLDFILVPGDTSPHYLGKDPRAKALKAILKTSEEAHSTFPDIPLFPCIGNNDLPRDYVMPEEDDTLYSDLLDIWQDAILCKHCNRKYQTTTLKELRKTFLYGGYYSVSIVDGKMTLLVLNSLYWARPCWTPNSHVAQRALAQMDWLKEQFKLARRNKKKIIIGGHISLGMDVYAQRSTWMKPFTEQYIDLVVNKFSDVIAGQIFAHFHRDSFRLLSDKKKDSSYHNSSYVLLVPSISPSSRNNPAFRIVHLDPDLQAITDYEQYYMNITKTGTTHPVWQLDYKFSSRYPPSGNDDQVINGRRIKNLSDNLINQTDDSVFKDYISSRQVRYQPHDPYTKLIYYCAITCLRKKEFNACQKKYSAIKKGT